MPPCFTTFPSQPSLASGYKGYAESGFVTPEMSPLDGRQPLSPPNLLPVMPSCYLPLPNALSYHSRAPSYVDALVRQRRAIQSTGNSFGHGPETGNRSYDGICTGDNICGISFHARQTTARKTQLSTDILQMTSFSSHRDVIAKHNCSSLGHSLPVGSLTTGCRNHRQFPTDSADMFPWYLRFPEYSQLDPDMSVDDVEPAELDQYLNRRSMSPSCNIGDTTRTAIRTDPPPELRMTEEVGRYPLPITSPEVGPRLGSCETEDCFFDVDFSISGLDNLPGITSVEGRPNLVSSSTLSAASPTTFVEALTGSRYSGIGRDGKPEVGNTSTSSLLSEEEVHFEPLRTPCAVNAADDEQQRRPTDNVLREMPTFSTSDCINELHGWRFQFLLSSLMQVLSIFNVNVRTDV